jgi:hypothetical protein
MGLSHSKVPAPACACACALSLTRDCANATGQHIEERRGSKESHLAREAVAHPVGFCYSCLEALAAASRVPPLDARTPGPLDPCLSLLGQRGLRGWSAATERRGKQGVAPQGSCRQSPSASAAGTARGRPGLRPAWRASSAPPSGLSSQALLRSTEAGLA